MKHTVTELSKSLVDFSNRFGIIILVTIVSMIARSVYKGTSIRRLLLKIPISAIIGMVLGVLLQEYTDTPTNVIIISCSVVGAYSGEVLDGIEQLVQWIPQFIKKVIQKKFDIEDDPKNDHTPE